MIIKRFYDTKAYKLAKRKKKLALETIDFIQIKSILNIYSLGMKGPVFGISNLSNLNEKPLKGSVNFPFDMGNSNAIIGVLAQVSILLFFNHRAI